MLSERGQPDGAPSSTHPNAAGTATGSVPRRRTASANPAPTYAAPTVSSIRRGNGVGAPSSTSSPPDVVSSTTPSSASPSASATQPRVKRTSSRLMTGGGVRQRTRGSTTSHQLNQQTLIQCPLCGRQFERSVVEVHAATCEGRDPEQVGSSLVLPVRLLFLTRPKSKWPISALRIRSSCVDELFYYSF